MTEIKVTIEIEGKTFAATETVDPRDTAHILKKAQRMGSRVELSIRNHFDPANGCR